MIDISKEKINPFPSTIENTVIILDQMKKSVCKIESIKGNATAFFAYLPYLDKKFPVLITTNHIINEEIILESNLFKVTINDGKEKKFIDLNESRKIYTNIKYDTTIIEIKPEKDKIHNFLEVDKYIFNEELTLFNESIYMLHYQKFGKELKSSVSYGSTKSIEDDYNINYFCYAEKSSAGGPILNIGNNKLIGLHTNGGDNFNIGTLLKNPINEYINDFNLINKNNIIEKNNKKDEIKKKNKIKNNKIKNEIHILLKIEKDDINNDIYFLDNSARHNNLKELNESNVILFINDFKLKYKKYFKPEKEGIYYIKLKFKNIIKDCSYMFYKSYKLKNVDLAYFNSQNVTNMRYMFCDCNNLENINLSDLNTEKVKDMSLIFYNCTNLTNIDLSSFNTKLVNDYHWMFYDCNNLKYIKLKDCLYNKIKEGLNSIKNLKIVLV